MAKKVLTNLDLVLNQLLNTRLHQIAGNPSTLVESLFWYDSTNKKPMYYDGTNVKNFGIEYTSSTGIDITDNVISVNFDDVATAAQGSLADSALQPGANLSSLTDDSSTHPIAKANTLTGLTATITELNYTDGVTSNIQTQLNGKQATIDSSHKLLSDLVDDTNQTHKFATSSQLTQINTNKNNITTINGKIPSAASTSNQLADKQYVDNAVQTNSAHFRGNWTTWSAVPTGSSGYPADDDGNKTPTVNDYMVVQDASDYTGETLDGAWQFTYTGVWSTNGKAGWLPRFQINEDPLTPSQQAALDSGITSTLVTQIGTNQSDISALQTAVSGKQDALTFSTGLTNTSGTITVTDYNKLLKNTATENTSLVIMGTDSGTNMSAESIALGHNSKVSALYSIAIGYEAKTTGTVSKTDQIAIGPCAASSGNMSIQIGAGTNSTDNTLQIWEHTLLDKTTGLIPDTRISTNIARTSDISNVTQRYSTTNPALTTSGGLCTWTITHNLGRQFVQVKVYETSTGEEVIVDVVCTSTTVATVKINSSANITAGAYTVVVQG